MAVLVPSYTYFYGPTNFLYFCDVAASDDARGDVDGKPAVGLDAGRRHRLPQALWVADFLGGLTGHYVTGMTAYMFHGDLSFLSLFKRGLSFFHFWIPFLVPCGMLAPADDRCALAAWTGMAWMLF